jgi:hypothetical protein
MQDVELVRIRWLNHEKATRQKKAGGRQGDIGARKVIQWTSKAWTAFDLKLPVFYRESLARLLALERYRNLIETNITAGITLHTYHKPGLFENSLSNKGKLSAWRLLETADVLSIVENLYRTGGKMLLADHLSRLCTSSEGFYVVTLPAKINTLLENLPLQVAVCRTMRISANKDTAVVSRIVQKCRKPTSPISQGKLGSFVEPKSQVGKEVEAESFSVDTDTAAIDAVVKLNAFSICRHSTRGHWSAGDTRTHKQWKGICGSQEDTKSSRRNNWLWTDLT